MNYTSEEDRYFVDNGDELDKLMDDQSLMNYLTCQNGMLNGQLKMKVSVICMMILPILSSWTMLFVT